MIFSELRDQHSETVQQAVKRKCPVCNQDSGTYCVTVTDGVPTAEAWGSWVHLIRADGLKYTSAETKGWKK